VPLELPLGARAILEQRVEVVLHRGLLGLEPVALGTVAAFSAAPSQALPGGRRGRGPLQIGIAAGQGVELPMELSRRAETAPSRVSAGGSVSPLRGTRLPPSVSRTAVRLGLTSAI